jgi:branched-chain amino acid transport system substrate-binding protein
MLKRLLPLLALLAAAPAGAALSDAAVKVGILTDLNSVYAHFSGPGMRVAAEMAIEDFRARNPQAPPIDLVTADHGNDAGKAAGIARRWLYEEGIDVIAEVTGSPPALAVQRENRDKQAVLLFNAVVSTALTNEACSTTGFHWMFDAYVYTRALGELISRRGGNLKWYAITVDNAYGDNLFDNLKQTVEANGGRIIGRHKYALGQQRFLRALLEAQAAKPDVVALGSAGEDLVNLVKQAFDLRSISQGDITLTAPGMAITSVHEVGLPLAQGILLPSAYYWDLDARSRAWALRFLERTGRMPSEPQAGVYSSLSHYLKAVTASGSDHGPTVAKAMRALPIDDPVLHNASIRADGRVVHDMYLVRVKRPNASRGTWDYFEVLDTLAGEQAFQPLSQSRCPLVTRKPGA